jgi:glycerophosphoryl diester phosphodiesterase
MAQAIFSGSLTSRCSRVVLDLKTIPRRYPSRATKTIEMVRERGMERETLITSFDHVLLADVRRHDKAIATGVLTSERLYRPCEYVQALGADAFEPACTADSDVIRRGVSPDDLDTAMIHELTGAGVMVNVWTENSESRMASLIDAGMTGIFTDYPNRLTRALAAADRVVPSRPQLRPR